MTDNYIDFHVRTAKILDTASINTIDIRVMNKAYIDCFVDFLDKECKSISEKQHENLAKLKEIFNPLFSKVKKRDEVGIRGEYLLNLFAESSKYGEVYNYLDLNHLNLAHAIHPNWGNLCKIPVRISLYFRKNFLKLMMLLISSSMK